MAINLKTSTNGSMLRTGGALLSANGPLTYLSADCAAPAFSAVSTYKVGDVVSYGHLVYRCILDKSTASATTPDDDTTHWQMSDLMTAVDSLQNHSILVVRLTDGTETMSSIKDRLTAYDTERQTVLFDTMGIADSPMRVCTIYFDMSNNMVRVYDIDSGKEYNGTYNAAQTISQAMALASHTYFEIRNGIPYIVTADSISSN